MSAPSHPRFATMPEGQVSIACEIELRELLAQRLTEAAVRLGRPPAELLADIITKVLEDDLIAAVLDDEAAR